MEETIGLARVHILLFTALLKSTIYKKNIFVKTDILMTIIRQVAHPPTFRPPVDDATILHLSAGERFLSYIKRIV